ncbi:MAG: type II secretion system protein [Campylobacterales bacterium]|nr:type II secretion system protein [Campylobacterales bacterium]
MRNALTMIELIFVIVILGILAAVAIPKISATRDDAKTSRAAHNVMTAIAEISSSTIASGQVNTDLSKMSNVINEMKTNGDATLDIPNQSVDLKVGQINDCVTIQIVTAGIDDNLTLIYGNPSNDAVCNGVQSLINPNEYPIKLRGRYVQY